MHTNDLKSEKLDCSQPSSLRFDVFKGIDDGSGRIKRVRSVGSAVLRQGCRGYQVYLDSFSRDSFHLFPSRSPSDAADFVIMVRKFLQKPGTKPFWRTVGQGKIVSTHNGGLLNLAWDLLGSQDIYMSLSPTERTYEAEMAKALKAVLEK